MATVLVVGCSAAPPPFEAPSDAMRSGWAALHLRRAVRGLVRSVATGGAAGLRGLRPTPRELEQWLSPNGIERGRRAFVGAPPFEGARSLPFETLRGSRFAGWCARGPRVVDAAEGFARPTLVIERLLVVGVERDGVWGVWLEGLALTRDGLRVLPWVHWNQAIERPRREHSDLALWDCDLGERPAGR